MPTAPSPDSNGFLKLQADDASWHRIWLIEDEGVRLSVEQEAVADPGTRGYLIFTAAEDSTKHRVDLLLDEGIYRINVEQDTSAEVSDYSAASPLLLGLSPASAVRHAVTLIVDEGYRLAVNQTPGSAAASQFQVGLGFGFVRRIKKRKKVFIKPTMPISVKSARFVAITEANVVISNRCSVIRNPFRISSGATFVIRHSSFVIPETPLRVKAIQNPSDEDLAMWLID